MSCSVLAKYKFKQGYVYTKVMKTAYQLDDLCRLCLNQVGNENIFEPVDMTHDILTITGVKVVPNDPLPQKICKHCIKTIKDAVRLKLLSKKNDKQLKYLLFSETDYDYDGEINLSRASQQPQVISRSNRQEQNKLNYINVNSSNNCNESTYVNDNPNTSNQVLKVREDLYNQSMIKNNQESETSHIQDNCDIRAIVKEENVEPVEEDQSLLIPIENNQESETQENCDMSAIMIEENLEPKGEDQSLLVPVKHQKLSDRDEDQLFSYECEKCFKIFESRKKLTIHARTHMKKYRCPVEGCDKKFACNNDLYKHIRCHTGEKPYQCDICLRCFTQNGTLRSHKINIHGIVPQIKGTRIKYENQGLALCNFQPDASTNVQTYEMPLNLQPCDSVGMPDDTRLEEFESKFLVTSNNSESNFMENELSELHQVPLSTENKLNGQENNSEILSSIKIRLSPKVDGESLEASVPIESIYFQKELTDSSTPKLPTRVPS